MTTGTGGPRGAKVARLRFYKQGMAGLERHIGQQLEKAEVEAKEAAAREATPRAKARAFARGSRGLHSFGVTDVNE